MAKLLDGIERKREAIVTNRPAAIEADLPPELEQPLAARVKRAHDEDVARRIWQRRRHAVGAGGHARGHRPPRLADDRRQAARGGRHARRLRARSASPTGCTDAVLLGMGGSSLAPEVFRRSLRAARGRRCACTCSTPPSRCRSRPSSDAIDLAKTLFIVSSKSGGTIETIVAVQALPRAPGRRRALRRRHRPGLEPARARRGARLPPRVPERPGDRRALLGAVVLRARARRARRLRRRARVLEGAQVARRRAGLRAPGGQRRPVARRWRSASSRAPGRDKLTFVVDDAAGVVRPLGRAARRRVAPASRAAASCRSPTSRSPTPAPTATTACSCTSRTDDAGRRARRGDRRARRRPATR